MSRCRFYSVTHSADFSHRKALVTWSLRKLIICWKCLKSCEIFEFQIWKQKALSFSHSKRIGGVAFFSKSVIDNILAKFLFEGHSSGHTASNHLGLKFVSCPGVEQMGSQTHTDFDYYIYKFRPFIKIFCNT
jgi:hypothetical protein